MGMRYIAAAGTPISFRDLANWIYNVVAEDNIHGRFKQEICQTFGTRHCFFLSTGRAALCALLRSLAQLSVTNKNEIVIPSYTCFSVPSSVAKAGLKIHLCDVDPNTLGYDLEKLAAIDFTNVLVIITTNLYGIPNDLKQICTIATNNNVFLIDDSAQSMYGRVYGKFSGTLGDAGLYSLDKGKNITSMDGGILVTNSDDLASSIEAVIEDLPGLTLASRISYVARLVFYAVFLHPSLYWLPHHLPFLKLGTTVYTTKYHVAAYDSLLGAMGIQVFRHIEDITAARIKNGSYLKKHLSDLPLVQLPHFQEHVNPVYLRFPVLIEGRALRNKVIEELNRKGIGATASYPTPINDISEIQSIIVNRDSEFPGGRQVAWRIVTLPTHPYVTEKDLFKTVKVIKELVNTHI